MTSRLACCDLFLGKPDVAQHRKLFDHIHIGFDIHEHSGAAAMLRQYNGLAGLLDLLDKLCRIGAELSNGAGRCKTPWGWTCSGDAHPALLRELPRAI